MLLTKEEYLNEYQCWPFGSNELVQNSTRPVMGGDCEVADEENKTPPLGMKDTAKVKTAVIKLAEDFYAECKKTNGNIPKYFAFRVGFNNNLYGSASFSIGIAPITYGMRNEKDGIECERPVWEKRDAEVYENLKTLSNEKINSFFNAIYVMGQPDGSPNGSILVDIEKSFLTVMERNGFVPETIAEVSKEWSAVKAGIRYSAEIVCGQYDTTILVSGIKDEVQAVEDDDSVLDHI
jgi:hypothetical protein